MTDPIDPTAAGAPETQPAPEAPAQPEAQPAAEPQTAPTAEAAAAATETTAMAAEATAPAPEAPAAAAPEAAAPAAAPFFPAPGSLFQDRELTAVEMKRLDIARMQPKPWEPTDELLDPTRDDGWDVAAGHELIAVRPEDVVSPEMQPFVPPTAAAPAVSTPAPPVGPATAAFSWASAASATPALGAAPSYPTPAILPSPTPAPAAGLAQVPTGAAPFAAPALAVVAPVEVKPAGPSWWRRAAARTRGSLRIIARPVAIALLFLVGLGFGFTAYVRSLPVPQPPVPVAVAQSDGTTTVVPAQVLSLIDALQSDNQTKVQLVVPAQPYRLLAGELAVDGISSIVGAKAMSTYTVGPDSATEILITGLDQSGNALTFNLVVHIHNGAITDFR